MRIEKTVFQGFPKTLGQHISSTSMNGFLEEPIIGSFADFGRKIGNNSQSQTPGRAPNPLVKLAKKSSPVE